MDVYEAVSYVDDFSSRSHACGQCGCEVVCEVFRNRVGGQGIPDRTERL
jgi:hypothetical protein